MDDHDQIRSERKSTPKSFYLMLSNYNLSRPETRAFTLVEIMIAMLIMAAAVIPVVAFMTTNVKETNVSEAYVSMMHQSTLILDTILERVKYADLIKTAKTLGLSTDTDETLVTIPNLLDIKDSLGNSYFQDELNYGGGTDPRVAGKTWQYADTQRRMEPIAYTLSIKQMKKDFRYLMNKNVNNAAEIPSASDPAAADVGKVTIEGKLMKVTLIVEWGQPRTGNPNPFQNRYSLVTLKAKLED